MWKSSFILRMKSKISFIAYCITLAALLPGCYVSKTLDVEKRLFLVDDFDVNIKAAEISKYIYNASTVDYKDEYLAELRKLLGTSKVIIVEDGSQADYVLELKEMQAKETAINRTIKDSTSAQNGDRFMLHYCNVKVEAILYRGFMEEKVKSWNITASKNEKLTTNKNLQQVQKPDPEFGTGKVYTHLTLDQDIFMQLCRTAAARTRANVTSRMAK